jgi:hypothetical protein
MSLFMDQSLARRLERAEASIGVGYVGVRQRLEPSLRSAWQDIGGAYAFFDGPSSILTQSFGLGLFTPAAEAIGALEAFFETRAAAAQHEVSLLAGVDTHALLADRGYRPVELSNVLVLSLGAAQRDAPAATAPSELRVRRCAHPSGAATSEALERDERAWMATAAAGWSDTPDVGAFIDTIARVAFHNPLLVNFFIERGGEPIGTASLAICDDVAVLAGASTVPAGRGRGAQAAALAVRLAEATAQRCTLAMLAATPGSGSQRNAERAGFRVAYSRTKWARPASRA